jgi:hypothetical protein
MSEFRIYKPFKDKNTGQFKGYASKIEVNEKEVEVNKKKYMKLHVFWTMTEQIGEDENGNASFNWVSEKNPNGKQVVISLGDPDIGEFLAVLNGVKKKVGQPNGKGLYHETSEKANKGMTFEFVEKEVKPGETPQYDPGYRVGLSKKDENGVVRFSHTISLGEAEILKILFTDAIRKKYWVD